MTNFLKILFCNFLCFSSLAQEEYAFLYEFEDQNNYVLTAELLVKDNLSLFKIKDDRASGMQYDIDSNPLYSVVNDELSTFFFDDGSNVYNRIPYPPKRGGTIYMYTNQPLKWQFTDSTKVIQKYNCQQALVIHHNREYTAWFTTDIAINKGPMRLHGLPGAILELNENTGLFKMKLLSYNTNPPDNEKEFNIVADFFNKNTVLNYTEYVEFMKEYILLTKIKKAQKLAEIMKLNGGTLSINLGNGDYHFVRYIYDIPDGLIEELGKIDFYDN